MYYGSMDVCVWSYVCLCVHACVGVDSNLIIYGHTVFNCKKHIFLGLDFLKLS